MAQAELKEKEHDLHQRNHLRRRTFGENESGHIVSRHKSLENAEKAFEKKFGGTTGIYSNKIVELDKDGNWER